MEFTDLVTAKWSRDQKSEPWGLRSRVLALDPGETTGVAHFEYGMLVSSSQIATKTIAEGLTNLKRVIDTAFGSLDHLSAIVVEDYRVYAWKAKQHIGDSLHTARLIGAIEVLALQYDVPLFKQSAQIAKQFVTEVKLHEWGFYQKGLPHARDAIRHAAYFTLFGPPKSVGAKIKEN